MNSLTRNNRFAITSLIFCTFLLVIPLGVSAQFVPGQVIVKFVQGTEGSKAVDNAIETSPLDFHPLTPIMNTLQSETKLPLKVTQITGGQRIVLTIEGEVLADRVAGQLTARSNVTAVEVIPRDPSKQGHTPSSKTIVVTFKRDSPESKVILGRTETASDPRFHKMVAELETFIDLPITAKVNEAEKVFLQINLKKLTVLLIERLQKLTDIESAQPNYIMGIR